MTWADMLVLLFFPGRLGGVPHSGHDAREFPVHGRPVGRREGPELMDFGITLTADDVDKLSTRELILAYEGEGLGRELRLAVELELARRHREETAS